MGSGNRVALVFRGDDATRRAASSKKSRLFPIAEALASVGLAAEDAVFNEEWADEDRAQLLEVAGVLVWWTRSQGVLIAASSTRSCARSRPPGCGFPRTPA